ncbi:MAG: hypothetical protein LWW96_18235 [Acidovorax sp.]|uniref:hypothetical protein n=1 Tax=Acidovorax sp. TaxID=1872122 RepID=UPI0025B93895|nr:hypothetical protein [Acidovorax sp.]MCE1194090.1 hypothetical protein [Acidovorax sp.]
MKQPHESTKTMVTTLQQRQLIQDLQHKHLLEGGSLFGQVFPDGIRIRVLSPAQTDQLRRCLTEVLGTPLSDRIVHSAYEANDGATP